MTDGWMINFPNTIKGVREGIVKKDFSAEEIFNHYLDKIKKENPDLNAYLSVFDSSDLKIKNWDLKIPAAPLLGVPCAIKDNMLVDSTICTAASKILKNYISSFNATVVKKLKSAGATILGKTNLDEFAMGSSTENSAFGPTRNPHDPDRVPGGSSGGSAAAVAADLAVFGLGSDTGGSIRQPASMCGVVGLKPTYGRVSRHGIIAMASSFDQVGPLTKNVYDAALVLSVLAGHDIFDSTTAKKAVPDYTEHLEKEIKGLKVGVPKEFFGEGLSEEVNECIQQSIKKLEHLGCKMQEISLPNFEYALAAYYILVPSEISANLARYDGIRYGYSSSDARSLLEVYVQSRSQGIGPEPKRRIMLGTYALSAGYYDAYYLKAQKVRNLIKKDFEKALERVDVIAGPVAPTVAFKLGEKTSDPLAMYLEDIYTVPVSLAGLPGISVPCGKGHESGMPVGLQIISRHFDEETILRAAHQFESSLQ